MMGSAAEGRAGAEILKVRFDFSCAGAFRDKKMHYRIEIHRKAKVRACNPGKSLRRMQLLLQGSRDRRIGEIRRQIVRPLS
jgi:hypothetical protein